MSDLFDVKGKSIVITGGAGVLGGMMAKALAREGAKICVADYDSLRAHEVCKEIEAEGGFALPIEVNVLDKSKVQEAFACAVQSMGSIDILINGAGGNKKEATTSDELSFFDMPAIQNAVKEAETAAKNKMKYFPKTLDEPFSVWNLQRIN